MKTIALPDAQRRLAELLDEVAAGAVVVITRDDQPAATLSSPPAPSPEMAESPQRRSLLDLEPISVGEALRPFSPDDDILGEMLEGKFDE